MFVRCLMIIKTMIAALACLSALGFAQTDAHAPAAPAKARVSTGVMLGLVDHKTMPVYPDDAMKKGIQGDVIFKIEVDETGKVTASAPVEGDPLLVAASKDALQTFHFRPFLLDGTPSRFESQLGFHFSVEKT